MLRWVFTLLLLAVAIDLTTEQVHAQSDPKEIVLERKQLMHEALAAYWPLLKVSKGKSDDLAGAADAARTMGAVFTKSIQLFPEGTAKGEAIGSRARPEVWSQAAEFKAAADDLLSAIGRLEQAASSADLPSFKTEFETLAAACIVCHEFKPSGGGKFRFAK